MPPASADLFGGTLPPQLSPRLLIKQQARLERLNRPSKRWHNILRNHGNVSPDDPRTDLQRYLDAFYRYAVKRTLHGGSQSRLTLAVSMRKLHHKWLRRIQLEEIYIARLNRGADFQTAYQRYHTMLERNAQSFIALVEEARQAFRYCRSDMTETNAMWLEVFYYILFTSKPLKRSKRKGMKSVLIQLTRMGVYNWWAQKYPNLWRVIPGYPDPEEEEKNWPYNPAPEIASYPLWYDQFAPGDLTRLVRELAPAPPKDRQKVFSNSPAFRIWSRKREVARKARNNPNAITLRRYTV